MSDKRLTVITEGGKVFGVGHIIRTLAIADIFVKKGYEVNFIINGDESIREIFKYNDMKYTLLNWQENFELLNENIADSSIILLDSMQISDGEIKKLELLGKPIIYIDDEKRRNILDSGFVIDWTVLSDTKNYFNPPKKGVTYLLGSSFTPLREPFTKVLQKSTKDDIHDILVTFGGADVRDLTPKILKTLVDYFPDINKHIVIGASFNNIKSIEKYKDKNTYFIYNANADDMVNLMKKCDISIASGGQTLYELARVGVPTIAILLVDNAKDDTEGWDSVGIVKNIGWYDDESLLSNLVIALKKLKTKDVREDMKIKSKAYISPDGALRLVDTILGRLK